MRLTMLGSGHALVTRCYNTCFTLSENNEYFLIDAGGGNGVLRQLEEANISLNDTHNVFITHKHIDHFNGIVWIIRLVATLMRKNKYQGCLNIYSHKEVIDLIQEISSKLLDEKETKFIGNSIRLITVQDNQTINIIGHNVTFFDIHSTKAKQFGFFMDLENNKRLVCHGDEPINDSTKEIVKSVDWLLHEAFCLYLEADKFKPYEKHHSTVKDSCELAQELGIKNLILYHSEDENIINRKELYAKEGLKYFTGKLFIPNDLESIEILL